VARQILSDSTGLAKKDVPTKVEIDVEECGGMSKGERFLELIPSSSTAWDYQPPLVQDEYIESTSYPHIPPYPTPHRLTS
jgi:hypothetical protein